MVDGFSIFYPTQLSHMFFLRKNSVEVLVSPGPKPENLGINALSSFLFLHFLSNQTDPE